jgi:hypothetical protein
LRDGWAHFGPLRQLTSADARHPDSTVRTRELHAYLRWRICTGATPTPATPTRWPPNARERARIRGAKDIRWGGRPLPVAA